MPLAYTRIQQESANFPRTNQETLACRQGQSFVESVIMSGMTGSDSAAEETPKFPVVGLGASAGGIKALRTFFDAMPADNGFAFVVVMHLSLGITGMHERAARLGSILAVVSQPGQGTEVTVERAVVSDSYAS